MKKLIYMLLITVSSVSAQSVWDSFGHDRSRINDIGLSWPAPPGTNVVEIQHISYTMAAAPVDPSDVTGWQTLPITSTNTGSQPAINITGNSGIVYNLGEDTVNYFRIRAVGSSDADYNVYSSTRMASTGLLPIERVGMSPLTNVADYPNRSSLDPNINDFVEPLDNTPYTNRFNVRERALTFGQDELNDMPSHPGTYGFSANEDYLVTRSTAPKFIDTDTGNELPRSGNYGTFIDQKNQGVSYAFSNGTEILTRRTADASGNVTVETVHDFSNISGYTITNGGADSQPSADLNIWAFTATVGGTSRCLIYRLDIDTIIADFETLPFNNGGYGISTWGNYVTINSNSGNATEPRHVYSINKNATADAEVDNVNNNAATFLYSIDLSAGHHDYGYSMQLKEFFYYTDSGSNLYGLRLYDGALFHVQGGSGDNWAHVSYVSGKSLYGGGWVFVGNFDSANLPSKRAAGTTSRNAYHKNYSLLVDETKLHNMNGNQSNNSALTQDLYVREYSETHSFYPDEANVGGSDNYPNPSKTGKMMYFSKVDYGYANVSINGYSNINTYMVQQTTVHGDEIPFGGSVATIDPIFDFFINN